MVVSEIVARHDPNSVARRTVSNHRPVSSECFFWRHQQHQVWSLSAGRCTRNRGISSHFFTSARAIASVNIWQNTLSHAHFFSVLLCRVRLSTFNIHTRCSQELCCSFAHSKVIPSHRLFHETFLGVPDTFSSFCSSPPQTTPTSRPQIGIRSALCHFTRRRITSPSLASTSAASTRRSVTPRGETASTVRRTLPTQSQPPRTSTVFRCEWQPAVARSLRELTM